MSIALVLELTNSIPINQVLPIVSNALRGILSLTFTPVVVAEKISSGEAVLDTDLIEPSSEMIAFKIVNEPEVATTHAYILDYPEEKTHVAVSLQRWRTPLESALVAAVAIAFGEFLKEEIYDSASFYSTVPSQSATELLERLKLNKNFDDYRFAAQEFYNSLPKAMAR